MKQYAVITIHGTFASGAIWAQSESTFRNSIESKVGACAKEWIPFPWSGGNSHSDRQAAAESLADVVERLHGREPATSIHIVGHSHGGNVALMMLSAKPHIRQCVNSVTCLATPFLKYAVMAEDSASLQFGVSLKGILLGLFITPILLDKLRLSNGSVAGLMLLYLIASICSYFYQRIFTDASLRKKFGPIQRYYNYQRITVPVVAIRVSLDEAIWWIRLIHLLSDLPRYIGIAMFASSAALSFVMLGLPLLIILALLLGAIDFFSGGSAQASFGTFLYKIWILAFLAVFWLPITLPLVSVLRASIRMGPWGLGEDTPVLLFSKFACEKWPMRVLQCKRVTLPIPFRPWALRHSAAYSSDLCAARIACTISGAN